MNSGGELIIGYEEIRGIKEKLLTGECEFKEWWEKQATDEIKNHPVFSIIAKLWACEAWNNRQEKINELEERIKRACDWIRMFNDSNCVKFLNEAVGILRGEL